MILILLFLVYSASLVVGRDFAIGMFQSKDILVTQDIIYKERVPYAETTVKYGKTFACPITYFRVADRLGMGDGPKVKIIRGGLKKKYIVAKIWNYNLPLAATIQVGCIAPPTTTTQKTEESGSDDSGEEAKSDEGSEEESGETESATENEENTDGEVAMLKKDNEKAEGAAAEADGDDEGKPNENESLRRRSLLFV